MVKKVLIVEDDLVLAKMYKKKFELAGFEVFVGSDGGEGISLAIQHHPNVILLDIMMPKVDGITMMDNLRQDAWGKTVPIIILTNLDVNDTIMQKVIADQPSYYILKSNATPEEVVDKACSVAST